MALIGIGVDIVEVERMRRAIEDERSGRRFLSRVFTGGERDDCEKRGGRVESYAVRFAAKEAVMKALADDSPFAMAWRDIEVASGPNGRPRVLLHGRAAERAARLGAGRIHLSLSHSAGMALAEAVAERLGGG
jgi:holo-[acyl-carrier protein] synthase